jgi:hypothetical protein
LDWREIANPRLQDWCAAQLFLIGTRLSRHANTIVVAGVFIGRIAVNPTSIGPPSRKVRSEWGFDRASVGAMTPESAFVALAVLTGLAYVVAQNGWTSMIG